MKKLCMSAALAAIAVLVFGNFAMQANNSNDGDALRFSTRLSTFNEVPPKANGAHGTFRAKLSEDGTHTELDVHLVWLERPALGRTHSFWS